MSKLPLKNRIINFFEELFKLPSGWRFGKHSKEIIYTKREPDSRVFTYKNKVYIRCSTKVGTYYGQGDWNDLNKIWFYITKKQCKRRHDNYDIEDCWSRKLNRFIREGGYE